MEGGGHGGMDFLVFEEGERKNRRRGEEEEKNSMRLFHGSGGRCWHSGSGD
jgi:hypothetical protein